MSQVCVHGERYHRNSIRVSLISWVGEGPRVGSRTKASTGTYPICIWTQKLRHQKVIPTQIAWRNRWRNERTPRIEIEPRDKLMPRPRCHYNTMHTWTHVRFHRLCYDDQWSRLSTRDWPVLASVIEPR